MPVSASPMDVPFQATRGEPEAADDSDSETFRMTLLSLQLVTTVRDGFPAWKHGEGEAKLASRFHRQSYSYLDAITTLLLRKDEIVAAVESSPGSGIIMSRSGDKSTNPEVRCHFYFVPHLARILPVLFTP